MPEVSEQEKENILQILGGLEQSQEASLVDMAAASSKAAAAKALVDAKPPAGSGKQALPA
eukprot:13028527-Heterocapsa_arctica.AAC.1